MISAFFPMGTATAVSHWTKSRITWTAKWHTLRDGVTDESKKQRSLGNRRMWL